MKRNIAVSLAPCLRQPLITAPPRHRQSVNVDVNRRHDKLAVTNERPNVVVIRSVVSTWFRRDENRATRNMHVHNAEQIGCSVVGWLVELVLRWWCNRWTVKWHPVQWCVTHLCSCSSRPSVTIRLDPIHKKHSRTYAVGFRRIWTHFASIAAVFCSLISYSYAYYYVNGSKLTYSITYYVFC